MSQLTILFIVFVVQVLTQNLVAPIPGYGVQEVSWHLLTKPGGSRIIVNGTVQQATAQLTLTNPLWKFDFGFTSNATLRKRWYQDWAADANCNPPFDWGRGSSLDLYWGREYLYNIKPSVERPKSRAGPGMCGRVSCSYGTAIWWCNDNRHDITLDSFSDIADGALAIDATCTNFVLDPDYNVKGQIFSKAGWNVIVREDWSDGC